MNTKGKLTQFFNKVVRGPTLSAMKEIARTVDPNSVDSIHDHHRNLWVARAMLWVASRDIFQPNEFFSRDDYEKFALAYQSWNFLRSFDTINRETFENSMPGIFGRWKVKDLLDYCDLSREVLGSGEIPESFKSLRQALGDYQKSPGRGNWERVNEILKNDIYDKITSYRERIRQVQSLSLRLPYILGLILELKESGDSPKGEGDTTGTANQANIKVRAVKDYAEQLSGVGIDVLNNLLPGNGVLNFTKFDISCLSELQRALYLEATRLSEAVGVAGGCGLPAKPSLG